MTDRLQEIKDRWADRIIDGPPHADSLYGNALTDIHWLLGEVDFWRLPDDDEVMVGFLTEALAAGICGHGAEDHECSDAGEHAARVVVRVLRGRVTAREAFAAAWGTSPDKCACVANYGFRFANLTHHSPEGCDGLFEGDA